MIKKILTLFLFGFLAISCSCQNWFSTHTGVLDTIPGDINGFTYVDSFLITTWETNGLGLYFSDDGTQLYVAGSGTDEVNQFTLSTAWDITTASFTSVRSVGTFETVPTSFWINSTGTLGFLIGSGSDEINAFTFSTPYLASSMVFSDVKSISTNTSSGYGFSLKDENTMFIANGTPPSTIQEYFMSTAYDISTLSFIQEKDVSRTIELINASSIFFNSTGTLCYVSSFENYISKYSLSTPWDISTMTLVTSFDMNEKITQTYGMYINSDFTKMYLIDRILDEVQEYDIF